jgi:hypothetical protein
MILLEEFIAKTGKQPSEWTDQDIQKYMNYVKAQRADISSFAQLEDSRVNSAGSEQRP